MLNGYKLIIGALCVLLAFIGIANVFSNTLGFIRQRKREFARYMSIGMTPEGMRKCLDRGPRDSGSPRSDHAADYGCVCVVDDNGKLPESNGILAVAPIVPILLLSRHFLALSHWHITWVARKF